MSSFIETMKERARQDKKTIVLPESEDIRVLQAAQAVVKEGFANVILIGKPATVEKTAKEAQIDLSRCYHCESRNQRKETRIYTNLI